MNVVQTTNRRFYRMPTSGFSSSYSLAAKLGYPYIDNTTNRVVQAQLMGRFTEDAERKGPAIWIGLTINHRHYIVEDEVTP